ncbi:hypothetical protein HanIR_Chr08g0349431 [Helianthus annuus]|nr:hypothetical protein HanIR_Chr08g0349431 [Helianthus annuus]
MTEITCNKYCDRVTATIGPATYPNFFISVTNTLHVNLSSFCFTSNPSSMESLAGPIERREMRLWWW